MPYGDQTGPEGRGPKTGRALGFCTGFNSPGFTKGAPRGRGRGRGRGGGRRFGLQTDVNPRGIPRPRTRVEGAPVNDRTTANVDRGLTKEEEVDNLKQYAQNLKRELDEVQKRIDELVNSE